MRRGYYGRIPCCLVRSEFDDSFFTPMRLSIWFKYYSSCCSPPRWHWIRIILSAILFLSSPVQLQINAVFTTSPFFSQLYYILGGSWLPALITARHYLSYKSSKTIPSIPPRPSRKIYNILLLRDQLSSKVCRLHRSTLLLYSRSTAFIQFCKTR